VRLNGCVAHAGITLCLRQVEYEKPEEQSDKKPLHNSFFDAKGSHLTAIMKKKYFYLVNLLTARQNDSGV
jgi:hypothetical protein